MLALQSLQAQDLHGLAPAAVAALAQQMLARLAEQSRDLDARDQRIERLARDNHLQQARIDKLSFELARHKAWRFAAKTEAMDAEQRALFQETLVADQAGLMAQLRQARGEQAELSPQPKPQTERRQPRRQPLPEHLRRVDHHHEPDTTTCPTPDCGQPMQRVGLLRQAQDDRNTNCERAAGHRAGRVLRASPHLRQVGLPLL